MGLRDDEELIRVALEAAKTAPTGTSPAGAVFAADGTELARAANSREA
ncbi:nucleoside deaminase, partial [Rhodococcus sp. CX]|nr:nucleoside deaminase [Rhodococcus sp. CX]